MKQIQSLEEIHPEDRQLLDDMLKFSYKQNSFRFFNSINTATNDILIKNSLSYISADDLFLYNKANQARRQAREESIYIILFTTLAGALYNVVKTPVHKRIFFRTLKFFGLGLGLGYIRWRVSQAGRQEVVESLGKKVLSLRKGQL